MRHLKIENGQHSHDALADLPARAFLCPQLFDTPSWDDPAGQGVQWESGVEIGRKAKHVFILANGTWGADLLNGGILTTYEVIGYHANTSGLLCGLLASGAPFIVYRRDKKTGQVRGEWIQ